MRVSRFAGLFVLVASSAFAQNYSSYLGGPAVIAGAVDGSIFVATTELRPNRGRDIQAIRFGPASQVVPLSSVFIGGSQDDVAESIAVAPDGSSWITGYTLSGDFPLVNPIQTQNPGTLGNAFLLHLAADGVTVTFSTYLAPAASGSAGRRVVIASDNSAAVTGTTCGGGLTTTAGAFQGAPAGGCDAFVARFSTANALLAATYLGGTGNEIFATAAVGTDGTIFVAGTTESTDLPTTAGAFQGTAGARNCVAGGLPVPCRDGFIGRLSADLTTLHYLTYLRETDPSSTSTDLNDHVKAIAVNETGEAYVTGATHSGNLFPSTAGAFRTSCALCRGKTADNGAGEEGDVFVTRLNASGSALVWSTFLGGSTPAATAGQIGLAILIDTEGLVFVSGRTSSNNFPTTVGANKRDLSTGPADAFLSRLSAGGQFLEFSTFFGSLGEEVGRSLALRPHQSIWVSGMTTSEFGIAGLNPFMATKPPVEEAGFFSAYGVSNAFVSLDVPQGGTGGKPATVGMPFEVGGWTMDAAVEDPSMMDALHVYAFPNPGSGTPPIFLGAAEMGIARPDVASHFLNPRAVPCGWLLRVDSLPAGTYLLAAYGHSRLSDRFSGVATRSVTVVVESRPLLSIDSPAPGAAVPVGTRVFVGGWAIDQGASVGTGIDAIHVWVYPNGGNGTPFFAGVASYGVSRPDVGAAFGSRFTPSGYELDVNGLTPGNYVIAVFAHSTVTNSFVVMQTRAVTIQ